MKIAPVTGYSAYSKQSQAAKNNKQNPSFDGWKDVLRVAGELLSDSKPAVKRALTQEERKTLHELAYDSSGLIRSLNQAPGEAGTVQKYYEFLEKVAIAKTEAKAAGRSTYTIEFG